MTSISFERKFLNLLNKRFSTPRSLEIKFILEIMNSISFFFKINSQLLGVKKCLFKRFKNSLSNDIKVIAFR